MIKVRLGKLNVLVPQLIDKSSVNLTAVKVLILPAMVRIFYTILGFYEADISCDITYKSAIIEYSLIMDGILVEFHIII